MCAPTTPNPTPEPEATGRTANGRFAKGNAGGPGNPFARRVAALRSALLKRVTDDDMTAVAGALIDKARTGDVPAAKLLFNYTLGQPAAAADPDRVDLHEWQYYRDTAPMLPELVSMVHTPHPLMPLELMRTLRPEQGRKMLSELAEGMRRDQARSTHGKRQKMTGKDKSPSTNGKSAAPPASKKYPPPYDRDAWFVDLDLVPPSTNGTAPSQDTSGGPR